MLLVIVMAFILRCKGIWFGYPLTVHPDEPLVANAALNMVRTGDLNPHVFLYPTLFIYLQAMLYAIIAFWERVVSSIPISAIPEIDFYISGRVLNVVLSTTTIYITYEIGKKLFNAWVGLIAVCFISVSYLHTINSFYITVDSSVALWSLLSALMAVMVYTKGNKCRYYLAGGIFAGFAISSKYSAFPSVLPMIIAHLFQARENRHYISKNIIVGLLAVPAAFLIASPYALLDYKTFFEGIIFQKNAYTGGFKGAESSTSTSFIPYFDNLLTEGYGVIPTVLALAGICLLTIKDYWKALLLFSVPLVLFLFFGAYKVFFPRNIVAVIPFLSLFSGFCIFTIIEWGQRRLINFVKPAWQAGMLFLCSVVLVVMSIYGQALSTASEVRYMTLPDTRWIAVQWIKKNLPAGIRIGREHYTPPIEKYSDNYRVIYLDLFGLLRAEDSGIIPFIDFIILSSGDYARFVEHPDGYPNEAYRYNAFFSTHELVKEFAPDRETTSGPTIRIYRLKR